jgi:MFS family permease
LIGFAPNVYILIVLRTLMGAVAGYATACTTLIATQTESEHSGFALGTLATANIAGSLIGPTIGGFVSETLGLRMVFYITGGMLLIAFLITALFVIETFVKPEKKTRNLKETWQLVPEKSLTISVFITFFTMNIALFAIEPILTVYVEELAGNSAHTALIAGLIFSANGLANIIASPILGKLSDSKGVQGVILITMTVSGVFYCLQAFVQTTWQLLVLNFLLGLASGGLRPSVNILIKKITPDHLTGRIFGVIMSAGYIGITTGSVLGGQVAGLFGMRSVFYLTSALLLANAAWIYARVYKRMKKR